MRFSRLSAAVLTAFLCGQLTAGTIIYQSSDEKLNIMSDVKIMAIDGNIVTLKIGKANRNISRGSLKKYYDTDITLSGLFEDGSADYNVSILNVKIPPSGQLKTKEKKSVSEAEFSYTIGRKGEGGAAKNVRAPYFYLYLLVHNGGDYGGYSVYAYSYPDRAKVKNKGYNEALMLEKVLSADRPIIYSGTAGKLATANRSISGTRTATFKLTGLGNKKIVAYYLIVWGKTWIAAEKAENLTGERIGDRWWIRHSEAK